MPLFQSSVLNKYLGQLQQADVDKAFVKFAAYFHDKDIQDNIRQANEEQFQEGFLRELFVNVLDYTLNPNTNYNLTTEFKNESGAKKADGAILKDDKARGVIELKSTKTKELESIRQQAFDYKANHSDCTYVITSNFEKLRFYINNAVDFEEFDLFTLDKERFTLLYFCLQTGSLLSDKPLKAKQDSLVKEENVTKKLYSDYSKFKNALFNDITSNVKNINVVMGERDSVSEYGMTGKKEGDSGSEQGMTEKEIDKEAKLQLFKKTQKLMDRFLFIFFAEDRGLIPPNIISTILKEWEKLVELDAYIPLYDRFKKHFDYINTGWDGDNYKVFAYNGGLFQEDKLLDSLTISDEVLAEHTLVLTKYDFMTDIDVNILGHIFEHSLNEIEDINAELECREVDRNKSKRKKDGVFYTPKYITKYIVDNTVGRLCEEKKEELQIEEDDYLKGRKNRKKTTITKLKQNLDDYREWLLHINICDPACGSGAFLNQALEFLIAEHRWIDEMTSKLLEEGLIFPDIENTILENNLYGVDINEESVEIAKLSLWLRTAKKGRQLTSLNKNIKCGNSLIDDPEVAGSKAFKWEEEFPEVFNKGGFDVVIGNPPYVRAELLSDFKFYFSKKFTDVYNSTADLYVYFYSKGLRIIRDNGYLGFISPNKWMERKYGNNLRKLLKHFQINEIINYGELRIFQDASTEPEITLLRKSKNSNKRISYKMITSLEEAKSYPYEIKTYDKSLLDDNIWRFTEDNIHSIIQKFKNTDVTLNDYTGNNIYRGILTGLNSAFIIDKDVKNQIIKKDSKSDKIVKKMVEGDDFGKWSLNNPRRYMIATGYDTDIPNKYPSVYEYLLNYKEKLIKRQDKGKNYWNLRACDYYDKLEKPKIIYYHTALDHNFYYDTEGYYISANCYFISNVDRYLQCVLNSKLFDFIKRYLFPSFGDSESRGRVRLDANKMRQIPIKIISDDEKEIFEEHAIQISKLSGELNDKKNTFLKYIRAEYPMEKMSNKLEKWYELEFSEFRSELKKAVNKENRRRRKQGEAKLPEMSKAEGMEWMEIFEKQKAEALELRNKIEDTDKEIDKLVYKLYDLTYEEVKIVDPGTGISEGEYGNG